MRRTEARPWPCPFCGESKKVEARFSLARNAYFVVCGSCQAKGPPAKSTREARAIWRERE